MKEDILVPKNVFKTTISTNTFFIYPNRASSNMLTT